MFVITTENRYCAELECQAKTNYNYDSMNKLFGKLCGVGLSLNINV